MLAEPQRAISTERYTAFEITTRRPAPRREIARAECERRKSARVQINRVPPGGCTMGTLRRDVVPDNAGGRRCGTAVLVQVVLFEASSTPRRMASGRARPAAEVGNPSYKA